MSMPRIKIKKLDWSKINFRKVNGITVLALLSYLHVLVLIPMIFGRKSQFVQYHVRQGVILLVFWLLFSFSFYVPLLPWLFALYILAAIVLGIYNVFRGLERPLFLMGKATK